MSTCNRLDLETLGSQLIMSQNLPGHTLVTATQCFVSSVDW